MIVGSLSGVCRIGVGFTGCRLARTSDLYGRAVARVECDGVGYSHTVDAALSAVLRAWANT